MGIIQKYSRVRQPNENLALSKGQIKPYADWHAVGSPKKQTDGSNFFCHEDQLVTQLRQIPLVHFLKESMVRQAR